MALTFHPTDREILGLAEYIDTVKNLVDPSDIDTPCSTIGRCARAARSTRRGLPPSPMKFSLITSHQSTAATAAPVAAAS